MGQLPIDLRQSTQWAIASIHSEGMILAGHTTFDLVNANTGRAHRLELAAAGISGKLPISGSFSASNYSYFTTRRPVNFEDFDGRGARQTSASVAIYSMSYLTVYDGSAYVSPVLFHVKMAGWGPSIPSVGLEHGVTEVIYGNGNPLDTVDTVAEIDLPPEPEQVAVPVRITSKDESLVLVVSGDTLFDFDKFNIKPAAERSLRQAGAFLRSLRVRVAYINGYTDSIGKELYNQNLSSQRANAVAEWLKSHGYVRKGTRIEPKGYGMSNPIAPNKWPNGADDPVGRAKNRRVEIILVKEA
jgi:outer membrane protein OmpA-like peptidoglycan-associated protein